MALRHRTDDEKAKPGKDDERDMDERFTVPPVPFEEAAKRLVREKPKKDRR